MALLRRLREDTEQVVYAPGFERDLEQPIAAALHVPPSARLVLTEGNYSLVDRGGWAEVREQLDEVWYCDVADDVRIDRLVERHARFGKSRADAAAWATGSDEDNARVVRTTMKRAALVVVGDVLGVQAGRVLRALSRPVAALVTVPTGCSPARRTRSGSQRSPYACRAGRSDTGAVHLGLAECAHGARRRGRPASR